LLATGTAAEATTAAAVTLVVGAMTILRRLPRSKNWKPYNFFYKIKTKNISIQAYYAVL
jgi:hypothetical protein